VGANVSIPHTIDPDVETGGDGLLTSDIDRLVINCDQDNVLPIPTYTWTKDGVVVIRNASRRDDSRMIDDEFLMQGNNSLLLLYDPPPLSVSTAFSIQVDFTAALRSSNMTDTLMLGGIMTREEIRNFILSISIGDWQCTTSNAFGSDSMTSTVFGEFQWYF
jgi:hypothetical protein